jgi:hypothetical protein
MNEIVFLIYANILKYDHDIDRLISFLVLGGPDNRRTPSHQKLLDFLEDYYNG